MTPGTISKRIVTDRLALLHRLVRQIRALPLGDRRAFAADPRNALAAESCLRRSLEVLLDLGRHILAKGYGIGVAEYKEIADGLRAQGVLAPEEADLLRKLAGYRNRLVHFYREVSEEELYQVCATELDDLDRIRAAYRRWLAANPDKMDQSL